MKKHLLCTSAIALGVAAAAPATAAEWTLDWGGFMNTHIGIGDISGNYARGKDLDGEGFDIHQTGEIIFTPSITLDNGMTFGVNVQFEGQNKLDVDETYVSISGDGFGRLDIGAENSAGAKSMIGAPDPTSMYINSPSISAFVPFGEVLPGNFRQAALSSYTEVGGNNDTNRISYYTPSFNGLTIGVSYGQTNENATTGSSGVDKNEESLSDIFDVGLNYSQSFGNIDFSFGARWGTGSSYRKAFKPVTFSIAESGAGPGDLNNDAEEGPLVALENDVDGSGALNQGDIIRTTAEQNGNNAASGDDETWGVGFQIGAGGFTLGASYTENDNAFAADQQGYSVGVSYDAPGPWTFGLSTYQGEYDGSGTRIVASDGTTVLTTDETWEAYQLGASRALGPGVTWQVALTHVVADDEGTAGTDLEGTILSTALNLSF